MTDGMLARIVRMVNNNDETRGAAFGTQPGGAGRARCRRRIAVICFVEVSEWYFGHQRISLTHKSPSCVFLVSFFSSLCDVGPDNFGVCACRLPTVYLCTCLRYVYDV